MSQGQVNDIKNNTLADVTGTGHWHHDFQFLQFYSFWKGKIGFGFLKHEDRFLFLGPCQFTPDVTVWQLTVSENEFFALQITDNR